MKKIVALMAVLLLSLLIFSGRNLQKENQNDFKIITSFYPMYTIAKTVAGRNRWCNSRKHDKPEYWMPA